MIWRVQVRRVLLLALTGRVDMLPGRVVGTADGYSLAVLLAGNQQVKVHVAGIDTPELDQPFGEPGKAA